MKREERGVSGWGKREERGVSNEFASPARGLAWVCKTKSSANSGQRIHSRLMG